MIEIEGPVIALGRKGSEEAKLRSNTSGLDVFAREEHDQWVLHHGWLNGIKKGMGS